MSGLITRACSHTAALLIVLRAAEAPLWALQATDVPEINGGSLSAALGLLAAGILTLRSRRRHK